MGSRSRRQRRIERTRQTPFELDSNMVALPLTCPVCKTTFDSDLYMNVDVTISGSVSQAGIKKPCPKCGYPVRETGTWTLVRRSADLLADLDRDDLVIVQSAFGEEMTPEQYRDAITALSASNSPKVRSFAAWLGREAGGGVVGALAMAAVAYLAKDLSDPAQTAAHSIEELVKAAIERASR